MTLTTHALKSVWLLQMSERADSDDEWSDISVADVSDDDNECKVVSSRRSFRASFNTGKEIEDELSDTPNLDLCKLFTDPPKEKHGPIDKVKEKHDLIDEYLRLKAELKYQEKKNAYLQDRIYKTSVRKGIIDEAKIKKEEAEHRKEADDLRALYRKKSLAIKLKRHGENAQRKKSRQNNQKRQKRKILEKRRHSKHHKRRESSWEKVQRKRRTCKKKTAAHASSTDTGTDDWETVAVEEGGRICDKARHMSIYASATSRASVHAASKTSIPRGSVSASARGSIVSLGHRLSDGQRSSISSPIDQVQVPVKWKYVIKRGKHRRHYRPKKYKGVRVKMAVKRKHRARPVGRKNCRTLKKRLSTTKTVVEQEDETEAAEEVEHPHERVTSESKYEQLVLQVMAHLQKEQKFIIYLGNNLKRQACTRDLWRNAHEDKLQEILKIIKIYSDEAVDSNTGYRIQRSNTFQFCKDITVIHAKLCSTMVSMFKSRRGLELSLKRLEASEVQGEGLQMLEYEQLRAENQTLKDRLGDRVKDVDNIKDKITHAIQILAHFRNKMYSMNQQISDGKTQLSKVNTDVYAARQKTERMVKRHERVKKEEQGLVVESGLLDNSTLLRDYERTHFQVVNLKDEKRRLTAELDKYNLEISDIKRRIYEMKTEYPEIFTHQEELERSKKAGKKQKRLKASLE